MPTLMQLEEQGRALLKDQETLVLDDTREWIAKREEWEKREGDIKAILAQHKTLKEVDGDPFGKLEDVKPIEASSPRSLGQMVTDSDAYKAVQNTKGERFSMSVDAQTILNATITEAGGGVGGLVPQYQPGVVPTLLRRLTVSDLMPQGTMSAASLIYMQETAITNAAATVAEGAAKPQSDITLAQVTENARKIATSSKISDEMLSDVAYIQSYINGRLVLFVQLAEEDQLLNGNGTPPNLRGLTQRVGLTAAQAKGADTGIDAIFKDITKIRLASFLDPDGIVLNPTDWQNIRLSKDTNGQYYGGGPFGFQSYGQSVPGGGTTTNNSAGSETLWGVSVVSTPAQTAATAFVGAFSTAAQVFRRTGITVDMTNSNEDDFLKNLIAIRAEERLALAVYRPAAFSTVTGL